MIFNQCPPTYRPVFYRRYVDDTFLVFRDQSHIPLFLQYMNSKHQNIKFTSEVENDRTISFLDISVTNVDNGFETSVYRKATFTGLSTKFTSFIPMKYKRNLIATLTFRAFNICSNFESMHKELSYIKKFLFNNGFPLSFVDTWFGKTLNKFICPKKEIRPTVPRKSIIFNIPFFGFSYI